MAGPRQINPTKLKIARQDRSMAQIVTASDKRFSRQDLYNWEHGKNLPRPDKIPFLLKGLGVSWEFISDEISEQQMA